ncbi:MAG: DUF1638 domain-containing protein [Thermodesulfobacteriota bacterium]
MSLDYLEPENPRVVIACRVLESELEGLKCDDPEIETIYLDQNYHRSPHLLPDLLQAKIEEVKGHAKQIILGYGLCSNAVVGLVPPAQGLIVTRAHDCITLFLGSREKYNRLFKHSPGTYYITPGWIKEEKDPIGMLENEYVPKMGREIAEWGAREEIKHYSNITLIDTKAVDIAPYRERARENARFFHKEYHEVEGSTNLLQKILFGPYDSKDFFLLEKGEQVKQNWFIDKM